jgi:hypothetical protein
MVEFSLKARDQLNSLDIFKHVDLCIDTSEGRVEDVITNVELSTTHGSILQTKLKQMFFLASQTLVIFKDCL